MAGRDVPRTRLKKNDIVVVISGKDKGKRGKILKVLRDEGKIIVEGINFIKKHVRPSAQHRHGGIVEMEGAIPASKAMIYCPKCERGVRIGMKFLEDGRKVRVCKRCGEVLDKT
ncbi:MAG TPA: 50S ribosomal protein L24 [Proteobacteria bacterium]|nr:50S ribosomal protein L24 [Pseudomonadota bacterium]